MVHGVNGATDADAANFRITPIGFMFGGQAYKGKSASVGDGDDGEYAPAGIRHQTVGDQVEENHLEKKQADCVTQQLTTKVLPVEKPLAGVRDAPVEILWSNLYPLGDEHGRDESDVGDQRGDHKTNREFHQKNPLFGIF